MFYGSIAAVVTSFALFCGAMPGRSFRGAPPPLDVREARYEADLRRHVRSLAGGIGPRAVDRGATLGAARDYLEEELTRAGYAPARHPYEAFGVLCETIDAELPGSARGSEVVVVGAHYDSFDDAPGADDNASGVAGALALASALRGRALSRTVRFALFPNEEPPFFWTDRMGSLVYARELKARGDNVIAMVSLESIAYFSDSPGSQRYPPPLGLLYPDRGDFVAFVSDLGSRALVRQATEVFRRRAHVPSEGAALPGALPGVGWSDQWSFWKVGYPAVMITDTAPFRNPAYHTSRDTPETLDYPRTARVVAGIEDVITALADE